MDRHMVIEALRAHEHELRNEGVVRLALFGSVARGDSTAESDVDIMAEFDSTRQYSLLDRVRLENRLAMIVGAPVDLAPAAMLKPEVRESAVREAVIAF